MAAIAVVAGLAAAGPVNALAAPPVCAPGGAPVQLSGEVGPQDAKTYQVHPVEVAAGTTRVEVDYDWGNASTAGSTPLTATTVDLGIWDADGYRTWDGFRGWSGSRHRSVFVAQDRAERTYLPGPIEAGTWWIELGIAAVAPDGGWWQVEVRCLDAAVGPPPVNDPVDPDHVADPSPGWYHGDLHVHGYHSNPHAPDYQVLIDHARAVGLDFLPITEYVVPVHWTQLGAYQRANPDLLIWPGREIITYHGHATAVGETWGHIEYRHGFEDVTMSAILRATRERGALVGIAHPTTFDGTVFENFCRGCGWDLEDQVDWALADTIEVVTGPVVVHPGGQDDLPGTENPFVDQAVELWEDLLQQGVRLTAVGGSDDKLAGDGPDPSSDPQGATTYAPTGQPAVAVHARELSRAALQQAIVAGHVYVRTRGVADSPALELVARGQDGATGTFGDTLAADSAQLAVTVTGGAGQLLRVVRNGDPVELVPVVGDPFTHTWNATRDRGSEGPLGTWWRVETLDHESRTTIANPVFLAGVPDGGRTGPGEDGGDPTGGGAGGGSPQAQPTTPVTGGGAVLGALLALGVGAALSARARHERRRPS